MNKIYSIAGLNVKLSGEDTLQKIIRLPGFKIFEIENKETLTIDIHIYTDRNMDNVYRQNINFIHRFKILDIQHSFSISKEGYLYEMYHRDGRKIAGILHDTRSDDVFISSCTCDMYLKYIIWVAFTVSAIKKKVIPVHASSIVKKSKAVLFLGESGTGKSTHTRLWLQHIENCYLLNDDSPLLCVKDNNIFVCGSPWSGKVHCYRQAMLPLKAIVRLTQCSENKISHRDNLTAIGAVHPSFPPFLAYDESFSEKVIQIIDKIVKATPIYSLECRPDRQAAEIASAMIYQLG